MFGLACGSMRAPRAKASSVIAPRPSEWMGWPVTPVVPGGPSGRRWPTPKRRISIGIAVGSAVAPVSVAGGAVAATAAATDGRLRVGELLLREVALAGQPLLVRAQDRREPEEPDPDERAEADDLRREHEDEVEDEERLDHQQAERDQPGPPQPLPQVDVRRVPVERSGADVVEDDQHDQQDAPRRSTSGGRGPGSCRC